MKTNLIRILLEEISQQLPVFGILPQPNYSMETQPLTTHYENYKENVADTYKHNLIIQLEHNHILNSQKL